MESPHFHRLYRTHVRGTFDADAFFPEIPIKLKRVNDPDVPQGVIQDSGYTYEVEVLGRRMKAITYIILARRAKWTSEWRRNFPRFLDESNSTNTSFDFDLFLIYINRTMVRKQKGPMRTNEKLCRKAWVIRQLSFVYNFRLETEYFSKLARNGKNKNRPSLLPEP